MANSKDVVKPWTSAYIDYEAEDEKEGKERTWSDDLLDDELYLAPFLHHLNRPTRLSVPSYLKVGKNPDDEFVLQELDKAHILWFKVHKNDNADELVKKQVAVILARFCQEYNSLSYFRQESLAATDDIVYTLAIHVAVALTYVLYNQETLFKLAHKRKLHTQLNELWNELVILGNKGGSLFEAMKLIVQLVTDSQKYSFLTQEHTDEMLGYYLMESGGHFRSGYIYKELPENPEIVKDQVFEDIYSIVKEMTSPPKILKDDDYTRMLMTILKYESVDEEERLVAEAMEILHKNKLNIEFDEEQNERLHVFLRNLISDMMLDLKHQLMAVVPPLLEIYSRVDFEIREVIQVAELRRMAQGSRFIGRSHLVWAFYECGYGLPSVLREMIKLSSSDEDHPPYHIYVAAVNLAALMGLTEVTLLCFIFAVLYSDEIGFDEKKLEEMSKDLEFFMLSYPG